MAITPTKTTFNTVNDITNKDLLALQVDVATAFTTVNTNSSAIGIINTQLPLLAPLASPTFTGTVTVPTATASTSATTLAQVQALIADVALDLNYFEARVATTGPITLSGTQTIDTIALGVNDRVVVKDQVASTSRGTTNIANGVYIVATGAWTLAPEFASGNNVDGFIYTVREGAVNGKTEWMVQSIGNDSPVVAGTSNITFFETVLSLAQTNLLISNAVTALQTALNTTITANQATILARQAWNYISAAATLTVNQLNVNATATSAYTVTMITPIQNDEFELINNNASTANVTYALPSGSTYTPNGSTTSQTSIVLVPGRAVRIAFNAANNTFNDL